MIDRVFPTGAQPTSIITTIEVDEEDNRKNLKFSKLRHEALEYR